MIHRLRLSRPARPGSPRATGGDSMFYGWIEREELPELEALTDGDDRHGSRWVRLDPERERDRDRDREAVLRILAAFPGRIAPDGRQRSGCNRSGCSGRSSTV